jgi:hypothetical protein|tara:strand:- start:162 stop:347 length:186 start_codon:yes stop_codon:yes gene_type:complete
MGNMSYCRFENTMSDLKDCLRHIDCKAENSYDESARQEMLELFREINEDWGGNVVEYALYL